MVKECIVLGSAASRKCCGVAVVGVLGIRGADGTAPRGSRRWHSSGKGGPCREAAGGEGSAGGTVERVSSLSTIWYHAMHTRLTVSSTDGSRKRVIRRRTSRGSPEGFGALVEAQPGLTTKSRMQAARPVAERVWGW